MAQRWDFFISYTTANQEWAEWIAWQLEEAGYRVLVQAWDFVPGSHWTSRMGEGIKHAERTLAILSHAYLTSVYGQHEWETALRADPRGFARKLIPVRVEDCPRPGLLDGVVSFDLFGYEPAVARNHLLHSITTAMTGRAKPAVAPAFPVPAVAPAVSPGLIPPDQTSRPPTPTFPDSDASMSFPPPAARRLALRPYAPSALTGHSGAIYGVAFSPKDSILATASRDGTAQVWDVTSPAQPNQLPIGHTNIMWAWGVAFSSEGTILATAGRDGTTQLWDVTNPAWSDQLATLTGHSNAVRAVAFSPKDSILATASRDRTARLWDVTNPAQPGQLATLTGHTDAIYGVAFSPEGTILATASEDGTVRLWDVAESKHLATLTGHSNAVRGVAFSPKNSILATASEDGTVGLWDVTNPAQPNHRVILTGHTDAIYGVAFSPEGTILATASRDKTARLWDVTNPAWSDQLATLSHSNAVRGVAFSPKDSILATASEDRTVRLWVIH